jgi:hypothetical protein
MLEADIRRIEVRGQPGQRVYENLSQKYPTQMPSKCEFLNSNLNTKKKKKKNKKPAI